MENNPNGFPRLAAFQASDANFGLYRSYSYLHSRVLLDYQDEITELEKELDDCDWDDFDEDPNRPKMRAVGPEEEDGRTRRTVLREIKTRLMEYGMWHVCLQHVYLTDFCRRYSHQSSNTGIFPETI